MRGTLIPGSPADLKGPFNCTQCKLNVFSFIRAPHARMSLGSGMNKISDQTCCGVDPDAATINFRRKNNLI